MNLPKHYMQLFEETPKIHQLLEYLNIFLS